MSGDGQMPTSEKGGGKRDALEKAGSAGPTLGGTGNSFILQQK